MTQQTLDYVWVNEECEICMNRITTTIFFNDLKDVPPYTYDNVYIKPKEIFKNPFLSNVDIIVFCDMYNINSYSHPCQLVIIEENQRARFEDYMDQYNEYVFKITEKYKVNKQVFREHKQLCAYIGIDIFCKPCEYSIYSEKKNIYNYVWMSRHILNQLSEYGVEWFDIKLVPNVEEDIIDNVKSMEVTSIDEMMNDLQMF
jgi:hypothetical protein